MHGGNDGHWFHFDRQTKLKSVQVISRRGHIADMTSTDRWMPIVIAWSNNGGFMINFNRKWESPTHTTTPESHARSPADNFSGSSRGAHQINLEQQHLDTKGQNCRRNKASETFHKLFRPNHHKRIVAEPTAKLSAATFELPTTKNPSVELPTPKNSPVELPTSENSPIELPADNPPVELFNTEIPAELSTTERMAVFFTTDGQVGGMDFDYGSVPPQTPQELEASFMGLPAWDLNQQLPPSYSDVLAYNLDVFNGFDIQPAPVPHGILAPTLPADRPSSMMIHSNVRHHPVPRRGVSLTVNPPSQLQRQFEFTPISSASTYGSNQSSVSTISNDSLRQELATPDTPVPSLRGDSGYDSTTSPLRTGSFNSTGQLSHGPTTCSDCGTVFSGIPHDLKRNLKRHRDYHCQMLPKKEKLRCRVQPCASRFARSDARKTHEWNAHSCSF